MAMAMSSSRSLLRRRSFSDAAAAGYHVAGGPSYMRGAVFWEPGRPLTLEEFRMPRPKAGELLIKTKACGVCHSDLHVLKGELPFSSPLRRGPRDHRRGRRPWHAHPRRDHQQVPSRKPRRRRVHNAMWEPLLLLRQGPRGPVRVLLRVQPRQRDALRRRDAAVPPGQREAGVHVQHGRPCGVLRGAGQRAGGPPRLAAVHGVGDLGVRGVHRVRRPEARRRDAGGRLGGRDRSRRGWIEIARAFGASEVIAVDVLDEKLQNATTLGATHTVNAAKEDAVERIKEITGGRGVDVAIEALGKALTFSQCAGSVRDGGKAVMIGLAATNVVGEVDITRLVRRQVKIIGSYGARARQDLPHIVKLAEGGAFSLRNTVSRKCRFEEANGAYEDLDHGKIVGRAVVEIME